MGLAARVETDMAGERPEPVGLIRGLSGSEVSDAGGPHSGDARERRPCSL